MHQPVDSLEPPWVGIDWKRLRREDGPRLAASIAALEQRIRDQLQVRSALSAAEEYWQEMDRWHMEGL